ncbi:hypothetical protein ABT026_31830 [Streptomyces sp. NPDC002734]|uniref:hypothetical protein n=1 Tax=Streptomyces sp. NPDC002734 TaxID=3154426 RepID=UPI00331D2619
MTHSHLEVFLKRATRWSSVLLAVSTAGVVAVAGPADAAPAKYTHSQAKALLDKAGIRVSSSGNCSNVNNPRCTSLQGINRTTVSGLIRFKRISKCSNITVTGGTERGVHAKGPYGHEAGYKIDISRTPCVTGFVNKNFKRAGQRKDGTRLFRSMNKNVYADERSRNHWDILYYNGSA